ncbi:hypothetical protein JCM8097_007203 [Rhodosporidiobolus ruineniae]
MASASSPSLDMPPPPPPAAAFLSLSSSQRLQQQGATALVGLLQALATGYDPVPEHRRKLIAALLETATALTADSSPSPLLGPLATTLKLLGRSPAGSEQLARQDGLKTLVKLGGLERLADIPRPTAAGDDAEEEEDDDDEARKAEKALASAEKDPLQPYEAEALRCLCNTLTLHPSARDIFPDVLLADDKRAALKGMVRILDTSGAGFLGGRLLFLVTSKASEVISELAVAGECVEVMQQFAKRYLAVYNSPSHRSILCAGPPTSTMDDILREHLKLAYNLMLQYSRMPAHAPEGFSKPGSAVADEQGGKKKRFWRSREKSAGSSSAPGSPDLASEATAESPLGSPAPSDLPQRSKSPLSFAKRAVDAVKHKAGSSSPSTDKGSPTLGGSPSPASPSSSAGQEGTSPDSLSLTAAHLFLPLFQPYLSLAVLLPILPPPSPSVPTPSFKDPSPTVRSALATLLNFPLELEELSGWSTSWLQYVLPSGADPRLAPDGTVLQGRGIGSLGERLVELLHGVLDAYFPPDRLPDSPKLLTAAQREKGTRDDLAPPVAPDEWIPTGEGEAAKIEEILGPIMLLLRKLSMLGEAQFVFRELLYPPNLDRTLPLDRHPTLAGHLVRLLSSVLLPNTAYAVGEFVYNLCDRDPHALVRAIGYGNASGFLQNRGELIPPPPGDEPAREGQAPINPITGAYDAPTDPEFVPMSEEEKEREAERLYTLFDRMSRSGVISAQNPVDAAKASGRFEETSEQREEELKRLKREDEELEKEVERDMAAWKERRKKAADAGVDPAKVEEA